MPTLSVEFRAVAGEVGEGRYRSALDRIRNAGHLRDRSL
jgi:hypothetical protein